MLDFFRRYEKYFFIVITIVIVVSFSFFGTYNTIEKTQYVDKTVFTAINGTEIKASTLEEMVIFLGTDKEDKMLFGGAWGPNFLNDGVIKKDFIETGLAQILIKPFLDEIRDELESRFQKEKRFVLYENPQAKFINTINAWNMVAPQITEKFEAFRLTSDPASLEAFEKRVNLFQAQKQLPSHILRYVLRHQERQNNWITPDPNLDRIDLSLFGYHTINDWFGLGFQRLIAEFIINSALVAQQQGYHVSNAEVIADLYRNAELSFQQNSNNPNLGVATMQQYFDEQLRRMRMDQTQAIEVWRKVMLFRRLFQNLGNSVFIDPFTLQQFENYAQETINGELYTLPETLKLGDLPSLQKFELYLAAVSERPQSTKQMLALPEIFKTPDNVEKKYPELVQRRYLIEYAKTDKRTLQANVGLKETWGWEVEDKAWEKLISKFPELGLKSAKTKEERYAALDAMDKKTRAQVDAFSRREIVEAHPEWLEVALNSAPKEKRELSIRKKGKNALFANLKDPNQLIKLLDKYPETKDELEKFTSDGETIYKITVLDSSPDLEILTFAEANQEGILDSLLDNYLKTGGDAFTKKIVEEINKDYASRETPEKSATTMIGDYAASHRLFSFVNGLNEQFSKDPKTIEAWLVKRPISNDETLLTSRPPLKEQWKLEQKHYEANRGTPNSIIDSEAVFALKPDSWSKVYSRANGEIAFLQLKTLLKESNKKDYYEKVLKLQHILSIEARQGLMRQMINEMEAKKALSLKYFVREDIVSQ